MNSQLLDFVRIELNRALADTSGGTKGQLQALSENPPTVKDRNPRRKIHIVELEGGREVKSDNSAVYVRETRSRVRSLPPIKDFEFESTPWRRAVNKLYDYEQAWVRYCYGLDLTFNYQTLICEAIWSSHQKFLPKGLLNKTKRRLIKLVWLAVQSAAAKSLNESYKEYAGAALASLMEVSRSTWCEIYGPHWRLMKDTIDEMDRRVLQKVLRLKAELYSNENQCVREKTI